MANTQAPLQVQQPAVAGTQGVGVVQPLGQQMGGHGSATASGTNGTTAAETTGMMGHSELQPAAPGGLSAHTQSQQLGHQSLGQPSLGQQTSGIPYERRAPLVQQPPAQTSNPAGEAMNTQLEHGHSLTSGMLASGTPVSNPQYRAAQDASNAQLGSNSQAPHAGGTGAGLPNSATQHDAAYRAGMPTLTGQPGVTTRAAGTGVMDSPGQATNHGLTGRNGPGAAIAAEGHGQFLPPHLFELLTNRQTITAAYAAAPTSTIGQAADKLFKHAVSHHGHHTADGEEDKEGFLSKLKAKLKIGKSGEAHDPGLGEEKDAEAGHTPHGDPSKDTRYTWQLAQMAPLSPAQTQEVLQCGQWRGTQPSALFLNMYAQALLALSHDALKGMVSPSLMGSTGVVPLTIISVIPDIIAHHANLIARAEREVFLATNFWEASGAAHVITDAMRELSRRVVAANREPVVIKLMYDRGNPKQVIDAHQLVAPEVYTGAKIKLPAPSEIPGVLLEVQNYHVPPVGTFHAKYMVVDRRIAILNSNNIQDRVNVEMMIHVEGPVVESFYDMALLSWYKGMGPPLPLLTQKVGYPPVGRKEEYTFGATHMGNTGDVGSEPTPASLAEQHAVEKNDTNSKETWDESDAAEAMRVNSTVLREGVTKHLNTGTPVQATATDPAAPFKPVLLLPPHDPVPMAMVNRPPRGWPGHGDTMVPQDQAWLAGFKFAAKSVFIQTPTFNGKPVVAAALDAVRRGILVEIYADLGFNDEGELLPFQGGTNEMVAASMYGALLEHERDLLRIYWYTGKDQKAPINATKKSRNCHVKIMIVDGAVAIQGNGNQDSQSWYHSQEINLLIDSPTVCAHWRAVLDQNQNTFRYGRVQEDGVWRDERDQVLPGNKPPPNALVRPFVGVVGAVQRVRGEGGFAT